MSLKPLARPVSIIGVSNIPQRQMTDPEYEGLSQYELFHWACQEAMEDAGIKGCDIDKLVFGQLANFPTAGHSSGMQAGFEEWIGMAGKPACHQESACATGYVAFDEAVSSVASGKYDIVMAAAVETPNTFFGPDEPPYICHPLSEYKEWWNPFYAVFDPTYYRFNGIAQKSLYDEQGRLYIKEYGISESLLDDTYNMIAINNRRNAARNPMAIARTEFADIAKEKGFNSAMEYMRSSYNPKFSRFLRFHHLLTQCPMAAAVIVCSADIAKSFKQKPIQVLNSHYVCRTQREPYSYDRMNREVIGELYKATGVSPEELDFMIITNMAASDQLSTAEIAGFLPAGQGYKYELDGRTAFDGDKPINTHGGDLSAGHAYSVCGLVSYTEAVLQMRGQAGARQIKKADTCLVRGVGGGHTTSAALLRVQE